MAHQVVVAIEGELSDHDAAATVHESPDGPVDYHLLIVRGDASHDTDGLAMLGLRPGDTFGSPALARRMHAQLPEDHKFASSDLGKIMARSAKNLRSAGDGSVTVAITHGDLLRGARALVEATGSQEVVIVADPRDHPQFAMPEWRQKASEYLRVPRVRAIEHTD
ncbi:hypothetical protein [Kribbella sp. NPDC048928]|uniref:hypothetical protein n=1 Tax=Kribbella sp. NPDC048928 TaxID=3364111 RepID=UPI0037144F4C